MLHEDRPPAIIDLSPAWAPAGMAEAIMLADVSTWERAGIPHGDRNGERAVRPIGLARHCDED